MGQPDLPARGRQDRAAAHRRRVRAGRGQGERVAAAAGARTAGRGAARCSGQGVPGEGYPFPWSVRGWLAGEPANRSRTSTYRGSPGRWGVRARAAAVRHRRRAGGRRAQLVPRRLARPTTTRRRAAASPRSRGGSTRAAAARVWDAALAAGWTRAAGLVPRRRRRREPAGAGREARGGHRLRHLRRRRPGVRPRHRVDDVRGREPRRRSGRTVGQDDGTWARARGWALWKALLTLTGCIDTDPDLAAVSRHEISEVGDRRLLQPGPSLQP